MKRLKEKNYDIGKVDIDIDKFRYPRYEHLRAMIYSEIDYFDFHRGWRMTSYEEDTVKKELIERLTIRIFFSGVYLYREFSDGAWKKIALSRIQRDKAGSK